MVREQVPSGEPVLVNALGQGGQALASAHSARTASFPGGPVRGGALAAGTCVTLWGPVLHCGDLCYAAGSHARVWSGVSAQGWDAVSMDRELFKFKVVRLGRGREFCVRHVGARGTQ